MCPCMAACICVLLRIEPMASHTVDKCSTNELPSQSLFTLRQFHYVTKGHLELTLYSKQALNL